MGRGRGKSKKLTVTTHDNTGSGGEEKIPPQKRRGRPLKSPKDEIIDNDASKLEEDDSENKDQSMTTVLENGNKRKRSSPTKEENNSGAILVADVSTKPTGFRHIGSRRKNKPRRAAEVGVECW